LNRCAYETDNEIDALNFECTLIESIGRRDLNTGPLFNLTDGGEGVINYVWTDEHRNNLSNSIKKAIREGRHKPGLFDRTEEYVSKIGKKSREYWSSKDGRKQKKFLSKKGKSLLVDGKRILSNNAKEKMRQSAIRTNQLKEAKRNTE
jgi:hypothetical protein